LKEPEFADSIRATKSKKYQWLQWRETRPAQLLTAAGRRRLGTWAASGAFPELKLVNGSLSVRRTEDRFNVIALNRSID